MLGRAAGWLPPPLPRYLLVEMKVFDPPKPPARSLKRKLAPDDDDDDQDAVAVLNLILVAINQNKALLKELVETVKGGQLSPSDAARAAEAAAAASLVPTQKAVDLFPTQKDGAEEGASGK